MYRMMTVLMVVLVSSVLLKTDAVAQTTVLEVPAEIAPIQAPFDMPQLKRPEFPDRTFDIRQYGAVQCKWEADKQQKSTDAIRKAIEACHDSGGGTVLIPAGDWITGSIHLKSNVNLQIAEGAVVHFSNDLVDYLPLVHIRSEGVECYNYSPLIYAPHAENIAVTGKGTLHGHGRWWWSWSKKNYRMNRIKASKVSLKERPFGKGAGLEGMRPSFIMPWKSKNILIEGITLIESPMWNVHPVYSENIIVRGITIHSLHSPNGDGINPDSCKNVLIEYNHLETGDDAVTIKSGLNEDGLNINIPCENIVVRNFIARDVRTGSGGIVFGSETSGGIRNVYVHDAVFEGCDRGIRFKTARGRGNVIENIYIHNVQMKDIKYSAININSYYERKAIGKSPLFRNISIHAVHVDGARIAIEMTGLPEKWIENVSMKDVFFTNVDGGADFHRVKELTLENVTIDSKGRPIDLEDVFEVSIKNVELTREKPLPPIQIRGAESGAINIQGFDRDSIEIKDDVPSSAVTIDAGGRYSNQKTVDSEVVNQSSNKTLKQNHKFSAYLMAYFGPEEKLFYAYSHDARNWIPLNAGNPVFDSKARLRDPYVQRANGNFHMVHTKGLDHPSIFHWESDDLINWTGGEIQVVDQAAKRAWAPEFTFDDKTKMFYVYWASLYEGHNAIHYLKTADWKNTDYKNSKVYYDLGIHDIDLSLVKYKDKYVAFHKPGGVDDRMGNRMFVMDKLDSPTYDVWKREPGKVVLKGEVKPTEGPEVIKLIDQDVWYIYGDPFYNPLEAWQTSNFETFKKIEVTTPAGAKHCSMFAITQDELDKLKKQYPSNITPALPDFHADPHIAEFDGTYYIYPTTDGQNWNPKSFSCWSSTDLVDWKKEGVILDMKDVSWAQGRAWAPCIARKHDKYYFYFTADHQIGVAVSDTPTGPFVDAIGQPLIAEGQYQCHTIDPMVFFDDDKALLYFGNGNCNVVELNDDMVSFDSTRVKRITPKDYGEGAFVIKREDRYYLMWSQYDTRDPRYCINYAVSSSPYGPFVNPVNNPILVRNGMAKGTGHHSVVQKPGTDEWVVAFHRFQLPDGDGYHREVCLSPMEFKENGDIEEINPWHPVEYD